MSQVPYLKTEDVRDCTRGAQVSVFLFSSPKKKKPKLITDKLFLIYELLNHNLTLKLKKILILITLSSPKYMIQSSNTLCTQTIEKPRHKIYI